MIRVTDRISIDDRELEESFIRSSGPGGQNVNKVSSAVQLRFDARHSPSLPNDVSIRLQRLAGKKLTREGVIVITAVNHRSQDQNREEARERLFALIREAAVAPAIRRPTKPSRASKKRRLDRKIRRSHIRACAVKNPFSIDKILCYRGQYFNRKQIDLIEPMKKFVWLIVGVLLLTTLLVTAFIAINWAPDREVSELTSRWSPPPSIFIDIAGMKVHVRDEGVRNDPSPIILLHGTSASLHTWDGWTQMLKAERRVIRLDLPGFGLTDPSPDENYSIENYVRFITAILDKFGAQHYILAGNSFGGYVAWATALELPNRIDKLILVDSGGYQLPTSSPPIGFSIAQVPVLNRLFEFVLPRRLVEWSIRAVYGNPDKVTPELVDRYYEITLRTGNRRALAQRFEQARPGKLSSRIPELKMPTLILWGRRDRLVPPETVERFHHDIADSRVVMFDELGHVPHEEDPEQTVVAVREFLGLE
jgi:pimeloyl-ACP methyl ester carboxylesterase